MGANTGIKVVGDYAQLTAGAAIDVLVALIPNPDAPAGTGPVQGTGASYLDEMSPGAAAQLRVELAAMKAKINLFAAP